jgi:hypothetical protein
MKEFFHEMPYVAWSLVSVMVALSIAASKWEQVKWWWHNTWYSFPLIGAIARLSRDTNMDSIHKDWFVSEKALCSDYKTFIAVQSEHEFMENINYLTLSGDDGRTPMPFFIWILTFALVIVEALGFSYVLAGYTLPGASENLQETGALGIAFLISVILVVLTHAAGKELYKSGKIRYARQEWRAQGRKGKLSTGPVSLAVPQSIDEDQPFHVRLANRVGTEPSYVMNIVCLVFVIIVAVGATFVRGQVLEKQLQEQIAGKVNTPAEFSIKIGQDGLNFSGGGKSLSLPLADAQENRNADKKVATDEAAIDRQGGWGTFIVLAFVFIFLQIIGVYFGRTWGFAGKRSEQAYQNTGGFSRYEEVLQRYEVISDTAQAKLSNLQQRLMDRNAVLDNTGAHASLTFKEYMRVWRDNQGVDRKQQQQHDDQRAVNDRARHNSFSLNPNTANSSAQDFKKTLSVESALQEIEKIQDKESRKIYILSLDEPVKSQLIAELKLRKENEDKRLAAKQNEELDGIL